MSGVCRRWLGSVDGGLLRRIRRVSRLLFKISMNIIGAVYQEKLTGTHILHLEELNLRLQLLDSPLGFLGRHLALRQGSVTTRCTILLRLGNISGHADKRGIQSSGGGRGGCCC